MRRPSPVDELYGVTVQPQPQPQPSRAERLRAAMAREVTRVSGVCCVAWTQRSRPEVGSAGHGRTSPRSFADWQRW